MNSFNIPITRERDGRFAATCATRPGLIERATTSPRQAAEYLMQRVHGAAWFMKWTLSFSPGKFIATPKEARRGF